MKVLVVGGGGREHALVWKIAQSPLVSEVLCAPGNPGIAGQARCLSIGVEDIDGLLKLAQDEGIGLTVVGPEVPLVAGIVDRFQAAGLTIYGPKAAAAKLEGSKAFMKEILVKAGVPTARHATFTQIDPALAYIAELGAPIVVKADGLAAGKGVVVATSMAEAEAAVRDMLEGNRFGDAGATVVIEEFLDGEEASFICLVDGDKALPLIASQDHKRVFDADQGPNTGGMGAYAPAPVMTPELTAEALRTCIDPVIATLNREGARFAGTLYCGLMIVDGKPFVLEFNVRFGDPECQPLMMAMKSDVVPLLQAAAQGDLSGQSIEWHEGASVCVVMAAGGYPDTPRKGDVIRGLENLPPEPNRVVFHAGTTLNPHGQVVTSGGRVLGVTARGVDIKAARDLAYTAVAVIQWDGEHHRSDIAYRAMARIAD
ncbi:MAG: phosphoribosylamine--glycine ligase [Alphaproteobacteria bacterium CG_4_10_14_0_2_um_filter_63_37]|nr:MAG: phosphoribosylamine--glycine ligase [Proteobacteria bacterium CG1_02_64_396]PJA25164.1 MAG: phosphoribosylamine--glycine ligase [Alphaproteobacteria bacterium CG_4_10_14_0_2_um_filter_63_37]